MSQKLILPINNVMVTASIKTQAYLERFKFVHYGADMVSTAGNRILYASGDGTVVAAGLDNVVGNVVAIHYPDAFNSIRGITSDIVFRYFHLETILVKPGDKVIKDTRIGTYGNTGFMKMALHLHMEADTDVAHPLYSPTVSSSSFLKGRALGANDKTVVNPVEWLHCKTSAPDNQSFTTARDIYIRPEDRDITKIQ